MEAVKETVAGVVHETEAIVAAVDVSKWAIEALKSALEAVEETLSCVSREVGSIHAALPFFPTAVQESFVP